MERGRDPERLLAEQLLEELSHIRTHTSRTSELLATGVVNNVLEVAVHTFDSLGAVSMNWRATCGSIEVENYGTANIMVTSTGRGSRPNGGLGTMIVTPGTSKVVNVNSRIVTIWGTVGELVGVQAFTVGSLGRPRLGAIDGGTP